MVDINLIGDDTIGEDKTSEEKRVDEFAQTSSMDTQELAFEERTETFDTTKTAGFAHKRSYSSFVSTFIIFLVIVFLGWAIYYFMFKESEPTNQADLPRIIPNSETVDESTPGEPETQAAQISDFVAEPEQEVVQQTPVQEPRTEERDIIPPTPTVSENVSSVTEEILATSKLAIQTVMNIMTSLPSNLNTTLLSYAGQRVRFEFVSASASEAKDFTQRLNQYLGAGNFSVISESEIANNGQFMEKVLIAGTITGSGQVFTDYIEFLNNNQLRELVNNLSSQFGLQIRPLQIQQGKRVDGYLKTPILVRISGNKAGILNLIEEIGTQSLNIEVTKILLLAADMNSFSDENLILVINLFLYQPL